MDGRRRPTAPAGADGVGHHGDAAADLCPRTDLGARLQPGEPSDHGLRADVDGAARDGTRTDDGALVHPGSGADPGPGLDPRAAIDVGRPGDEGLRVDRGAGLDQPVAVLVVEVPQRGATVILDLHVSLLPAHAAPPSPSVTARMAQRMFSNVEVGFKVFTE